MIYYADCSMPSVMDYSFTVWSNLDGLRRVLTVYPSRFWWGECGERDGEHFCMVIYPQAAGYYKWIVRMIRDCVTVENLLADVEVVI
ncbi:MAG: hypothetical protein LC130_22095 [Bryobacterales bacterium]|nr:hypothetical protein [Bryobacterales bacterium]